MVLNTLFFPSFSVLQVKEITPTEATETKLEHQKR